MESNQMAYELISGAQVAIGSSMQSLVNPVSRGNTEEQH